MAITLEANYAKKLGLPNYSSHQYSVTIRTELTDLSQVEAESARLYRTLQDAVDREIQEVGFLPDASTYGMNNGTSGNGVTTQPRNGGNGNGNGHAPQRREHAEDTNGNAPWRCSIKQREFIEKVVSENNLNKHDVETLAQEMFGAGVRELDRMQASGLIDELLERHGRKRSGTRRPYRREPAHAQTRGGGE